jgi:subtilisin family serine protease
MHLATRAVLGALLSILALTPAVRSADLANDTPQPGKRFAMPGTVIIKFETHPNAVGKTGLAQVDAVLQAHGVESRRTIAPFATPSKPGGVDLSRVQIVHYGSGAAPQQVARELADLPGVEYAEPKWGYWISLVPNDPEWGLESAYLTRMKLPEAWDVVKGEDGDVVMAVVDGGTDWDHQDLLANMWTNPGETPGNGLDDDGNGYADDMHGWNFGNDTADPSGLPGANTSFLHGTHVGGIMAAVANNGLNVTGASWNGNLMAINAGVPGFDGVIGYGYEGIIYAASNGADVINCSWGGQGAPAAFELETIEWAIEQGAVVVAAAGNQNSSLPHYPSSYKPVLSVANVTNTDVKNTGSNYGPDVDVSAQGTSIRSTLPNNLSGYLTGTSMASPHAAAVAALVKTRWPGYTPQQVRERVRVTCDNIDAINIGFAGLLGRGRINAYRAVTENTPAIRISDVQVSDADGDGLIEPGELLTVDVWVTNYLAKVSSLEFLMLESSPAASLPDNVSYLFDLDSLQTTKLDPYQVQISPSATEHTIIPLTIRVTGSTPEYHDTDQFDIVVLPVFVNHTGNNVHTSLTSNGRLGYALALGGNGKDGIGFEYKNGGNLLYEGSLMIGDSNLRVLDAARYGDGMQDLEFRSLPGGTPALDTASILADQVSTASFNDAISAFPMNIEVLQQAYQFSAAPDDDYLIIKNTITNRSSGTLNGVRVGYFFDWDMDGSTVYTNRTAYDASRDMGYAWDQSGGAGGTYVGMMMLTDPGTTSFKGIWNDETNVSNPDWGIYDNFTTAEKWDALSEGFAHTESGPEDISCVIATGPFDNVAIDGSFVVAFALLGGDDLADLQANADAAVARWATLEATTPVVISGFQALLDDGDVLLTWRTEDEVDVAAYRILRSLDGGPFETVANVPRDTSGQYRFRDLQPEPGQYTYRIAEVDTDGTLVLHQSTRIEVTAVPLRTFLAPNSPNPFNPSTTLQYGLSSPGPVRLVVYDSRGRRVRTLLQENRVTPGEYEVRWNGTDDSGRAVASGVYFARLELAGRALQRRMTLLK